MKRLSYSQRKAQRRKIKTSKTAENKLLAVVKRIFKIKLPKIATIEDVEKSVSKLNIQKLSPYLNRYTKSLLKTKCGDFAAGVFAGIRDRAHGDVGTFLECARLGKKCVFINEVLSLFRVSSGQNSHNRTIIAHSLMEWLNYITISWLNHIFVEDKKDLHHLRCIKWCLDAPRQESDGRSSTHSEPQEFR